MEITSWFGISISEALQELKKRERDISYDKIGGDKFINVFEKGFYLHSIEDQGVISDIRVYFEDCGNFLKSSVDSRGKYGTLETVIDAESEFGHPIREIQVLAIPGISPTLPGKIFKDGDGTVSVYSESGERIAYIHIKEKG